MFAHLFDKIYVIDKDGAPEPFDPTIKIYTEEQAFDGKTYKEEKEEYPWVEMLFAQMRHKLTNTQNSLVFLLVQRESLKEMLMDYAALLDLNLDMLNAFVSHSHYCYHWMENSENIVTKEPDLYFRYVPDTTRYITGDYEHYPAELCINCLDKEWARKKFEWFRRYDIYNLIKKYQQDEYRKGHYKPQHPTYLSVLDKIQNDDSIKSVCDEDISRIMSFLKGEGYEVSNLMLPLEEYVASWPEFGYNQYHYFKFNYDLARLVMKEGYRIDEVGRH